MKCKVCKKELPVSKGANGVSKVWCPKCRVASYGPKVHGGKAHGRKKK